MKKELFIFSFCLLFISVGYSLLSEKFSIVGKGNLVVKEPEIPNYSTSYKKESWGNPSMYHYNFTIAISNNDNSDIYEWYLLIDVPLDTSISSCWGSTCKIENNKLKVINLSYNSLISARSSIEVGVMISTKISNLELNNIQVIASKIPNVPEETGDGGPENPNVIVGLTAELIKGDSWKSGDNYISQYEIKIKNNSANKIITWQVVLDVGSATVINAWNLIYTIKDKYVCLNNTSYNGNINIGKEVKIGLQLQTTKPQTIYKIRYITGAY